MRLRKRILLPERRLGFLPTDSAEEAERWDLHFHWQESAGSSRVRTSASLGRTGIPRAGLESAPAGGRLERAIPCRARMKDRPLGNACLSPWNSEFRRLWAERDDKRRLRRLRSCASDLLQERGQFLWLRGSRSVGSLSLVFRAEPKDQVDSIAPCRRIECVLCDQLVVNRTPKIGVTVVSSVVSDHAAVAALGATDKAAAWDLAKLQRLRARWLQGPH